MSLNQFRLDGQVVLITGATRGIGLAIAKLFGEAGARCLVTGRAMTDELQSVMATKSDAFAFRKADVRDEEAPEQLIQATLDHFGRLDILVNNAGIALDGNFHDFDDERLRRIMDTNLIAPFRLARAAVKPMLDQGSGVVLNMGSVSAYVANKPQLQVAYNASKAAIHQMTRVMAFEYAGRNIRVNALAPGYVESDMTKGGIANPEWHSVWSSNTPLGRYGQPDEMANCALFLCSPASSYVTGTVLVADGGYTTH